MAAIEPLAVELPDVANWVDLAACRGKTDLFFPPRAERPQARVRREAKALRLCHTCLVADRCRAYARSHHEYGFWGGESEEERHLAGFTVAAPIGARARSRDGARVVRLDAQRSGSA